MQPDLKIGTKKSKSDGCYLFNLFKNSANYLTDLFFLATVDGLVFILCHIHS